MSNIVRRRVVAAMAGALAYAAVPVTARAQSDAYPRQPIRWIVTFPPGGGADWMTRTVTDRLPPSLGQRVIVDNRPGASSAIGLSTLARSAPDGYTVASAELGALAMNPSLFRSLPYDADKDFQPISLIIKAPWILVANAERVPADNFAEFLELARAEPGKYTYASFGAGSVTHIMMELLKRQAGVDLLHVPYKGAAPAIQDLLGGQVDLMFTDYLTANQHVASGQMKALATSSRERHPRMVDLPTIEEAGFGEFDVSTWMGAIAPAGTPAEVVEHIRKALDETVHSPEVVSAYEERGIIPTSSSPEEFRRLIQEETVRWAKVIKDANIRLD